MCMTASRTTSFDSVSCRYVPELPAYQPLDDRSSCGCDNYNLVKLETVSLH
jgi:hypothetical protein